MGDFIERLVNTIARKLDRLVMELHRPEWHGEYGAAPVVCWVEHKQWPCKEYKEALKRHESV